MATAMPGEKYFKFYRFSWQYLTIFFNEIKEEKCTAHRTAKQACPKYPLQGQIRAEICAREKKNVHFKCP